jgi:integrase
MLRIRRAIRLGKPLNRSSNLPAKWRTNPSLQAILRHALHLMGPTLTALVFAGVGSGVAHAQGAMDFTGAQTLMQTFKNIGWHTFRHSFGTLLKANGEDVKTVQELLRHANSKITLDVYTQAVNSHKRAAQSKVVQMIVPGVGTNVETKQKEARTGTEA